MPPAAVLARASRDDQLLWAEASRPLHRRGLPRVALTALCRCPELRRARAQLPSDSRCASASAASRAQPGANDRAKHRGSSTDGRMRPIRQRPWQAAAASSATVPWCAAAPGPGWRPRRGGASPNPAPAGRRRQQQHIPILNHASSHRHLHSRCSRFRHRDKHRLRRRRLRRYSLCHKAARARYSPSPSPLSCCSAAAPSAPTTCGTATENSPGSARWDSTGSP